MWVVINVARSCRSASCQSLLPRSSDKPGRIFLLPGKNVTLISTKLDANSSSWGENTGLFSLWRSPRPPLWVRPYSSSWPPGSLQVLGGAAVVISLAVNLH